MVEPFLERLLRDHRDRFDYLYQGWLSDHGPMALMAMSGLGIGRKAIETFAATYQTRLDPLPPANGVIGRDTYPSRVGDATAYPAFVVFFDHEIRTAGWRETVATYLPDLISGWVRDALHPAIRLAYGIEFEVETEVAAGLAYFACLGPDPALAVTAAASFLSP